MRIAIPEPQNGQSIDFSNSNSSGFMDGIIDSVVQFLPWIFRAFTIGITIWFLISMIILGYSFVVKNGQWTKAGTSNMLFSLISLMLVRIMPILFFVLQSTGIFPFLDSILNGVTTAGVYMAVGFIFISLLLRFVYTLIKHEDFYRWSKRLFLGSSFMIALSFVAPYLLQ